MLFKQNFNSSMMLLADMVVLLENSVSCLSLFLMISVKFQIGRKQICSLSNIWMKLRTMLIVLQFALGQCHGNAT